MSTSLPHTPQYRCALALVSSIPGPRIDDPKARPSPPLTQSEAAELKHTFIRDMGAHVGDFIAAGRADGVVIFTPARAEPTVKDLVPKGFKLFPQRGDTHGEMLANAVEDLLSKGFPSVCLLNADCPTIPRRLIDVAIDYLGRPGDRMVLGSVDGGGFYLLGLKEAHRDLFERISSSASNIVAHTNARAATIGLKVERLPPWYEVNDAKGLNRLCEELLGPERTERPYSAPFTRQYLSRIVEAEGPSRISPGLAKK